MDKKLTWRAKEMRGGRKNSSWYWAIGILAGGGAVASVVGGNWLLALLILVGGFAIMVAGSRPSAEHTYTFSDTGVHINSSIIAWDKVQKFSIDEKGSPQLTLETETLWGTVTIPLSGVDHREIEMELKNRNIEEADSLETFVEGITKGLGL